jgi:two-component system nitrate/nitrite response regulator NarL
MNVLIVDDHPLVRKGLSSALSFEEDIKEIHEASSLDEAVNLLMDNDPEIAIIDLYLGREDGLKIVDWARKRKARTKFLVFTSSSKKEDFNRTKEIGVDGYLLKQAFPEDLLYALHVIARGRKFFDMELVETNQEQADLGMTKRELDVLEELGKGFSNQQIAEKLFISEHTVKKHISSILAKLNLHHRTEAALYANKVMNLQH